MKILFLIRSLGIGGAERQMVLLARVLKNMGHRVVVLSYYSGGALAKDLLEDGIEVLSLEKKNRWDIFSFLYHLMKQIRKKQPDVLYSFMTTSNLLSVLARIFLPRLKIIWGLRASNMDLKQYDRLSRITFCLEKYGSHFPDKIIANSYAGKSYATQVGFSENKIVVVPNGIDTQRFFRDAALREKIRQAWKINQDECLIGLVARIDPMKDYATFFKMANILNQTTQNLRFVAIGSGNKQYQAELEQLLKQLNLQDKLLWLAEQSEMTIIYNGLDILCSSSAFGEGFSNVLGEAMASGVPCVATDVGDARKIIGDLGKIVPIQNPKKMADACLDLLENPLDHRQIRQRIIDNFSVTAMGVQTEKLLLEIITNAQTAKSSSYD